MTNKRIAIVTGAYGKIGKAIATKIASNSNYHVVILGRNKLSLVDAAKDIVEITKNTSVSYKVVDLSSKMSIQKLAKEWEGPLNVIVNNAATTPIQRVESMEGIEMQFATNVLGYMWMMKYMSKHMTNVDDARIVNVASYWAGGLDTNDIEFKNRSYNNDSAYRQSKQAERMLSKAFSKQLMDRNISVNSCHPGDVNSKLSNNLGFGGHETPLQGADTPTWLAMSDEVKGISGSYFENKRELLCLSLIHI